MSTLERAALSPCPVLGMDDAWPETVYLIYCAARKLWVCYCHQGTYGLACFTTGRAAAVFSEWIDLPGASLSFVPVSFDEALDIAKERPMPITAAHLLDDIANPRTVYVK